MSNFNRNRNTRLDSSESNNTPYTQYPQYIPSNSRNYCNPCEDNKIYTEQKLKFIDNQINFIDRKINFSEKSHDNIINKISELNYDLYTITQTQKMIINRIDAFELKIIDKLNNLEKNIMIHCNAHGNIMPGDNKMIPIQNQNEFVIVGTPYEENKIKKKINKNIKNKNKNDNNNWVKNKCSHMQTGKRGKKCTICKKNNIKFNNKNHKHNNNNNINIDNSENCTDVDGQLPCDIIMDIYYGSVDQSEKNPLESIIGNLLNIPQLNLNKNKINNAENDSDADTTDSESDSDSDSDSEDNKKESNVKTKKKTDISANNNTNVMTNTDVKNNTDVKKYTGDINNDDVKNDTDDKNNDNVKNDTDDKNNDDVKNDTDDKNNNNVKNNTDAFENINMQINTLDDIIRMGGMYNKLKKKKSTKSTKKKIKPIENKYFELNGKKYTINLKTLHKLKKPLKKLSLMIGLDCVKETVLDLILYYIQEFDKNTGDLMHTVIEGPPGVGKTEFGKILGEIYAALGVIKSNKFKVVRRTDLIGEYLGHTAKKTQDVIDGANGGVLFIDEAYALGNSEKRDSYSKECIDTLNQNLTENKNFICIIAGYPSELDKCFFSYNPGLKRRFPFRFSIDEYKSEELKNIFLKKVKDNNWEIYDIDDNYLNNYFEKHKKLFPFFGGDMDNLFTSCKFCHSKRVFSKPMSYKKKINKDDLEKGLKKFTLNKRIDKNETPPHSMYC
jgi:hypothetical protein